MNLRTSLRTTAAAGIALSVVALTTTAYAVDSTPNPTYETRGSDQDMGGSGSSSDSSSGSVDARTQSANATPDCTTTAGANSFYRRFECGKEYGSEDWGAYYDAYAEIDITAELSRLEGAFEAGAIAFGSRVRVFDAEMFVESNDAGTVYGEASLFIAGVNISPATTFSEDLSWNKSIQRQFFEATARFPLGLFTAKLTGGANGEAAVDISGHVTDTLSGTFTPSGGLFAYVSASVGVLDGALAEIGSTVELGLLEVSVPVTLSITPQSPVSWKWELSADLTATALSGHVSVWWSAIFGLIGGEEIVTEWAGAQQTWELASLSNTYSLL